MAKYYIQCGPIQTVLTAESTEKAALAALDRTLQTHLWIYDDPGLSEQDRHAHVMLEALCHLDPTLHISEKGFDRADAQSLDTQETVDRWHRLMVGMRRLFAVAGLPPRSMAEVATATQATSGAAPRRPR